jgi:glutamate racemase
MKSGPIGIFDSGYGGLTVLKEIRKALPEYDYLYLGDNARAPYGTRSFDTVYQYTRECVEWFFSKGCPLVILACNTASAKALRTIQQNDLPVHHPDKKVLGVIRPTAEIIGTYSNTGQVGILATPGTVSSESYVLEMKKFFPKARVYQQACPMWVPLIESGETENAGADFFFRQGVNALFSQSPDIDTILLGCTHYPLIEGKIKKLVPENVKIVSQGNLVASSLADYLKRHQEVSSRCTQNGTTHFFTTDDPAAFDRQAGLFYGQAVQSSHADL